MKYNYLPTSLEGEKSMKSKSILRVVGLVLLCVTAAAAADGPKLSFKFKAVKVPGATSAEPGGVNNAGVSVGLYLDSSSVEHGYILSGTKLTTLDDPNATAGTTAGSNLNPDGAVSVVGSYISSATSESVGFLYKGGKYTDVAGPSGAIAASANAINDKGAIVGNYTDSSGVTHGFLLVGSTYTTLDVPGATATIATGINKSGNICFYWLDSSSVYESSVYNAKTKTYTTIDVPGAADSYALDLNAAGDVTYEWQDSSGNIHGALLHAKKYYKYGYPKAADTYGGGINDKSEIVGGYASSTSGPWSAFQVKY
jgi:probable HAF family extracellular repeat protein